MGQYGVASWAAGTLFTSAAAGPGGAAVAGGGTVQRHRRGQQLVLGLPPMTNPGGLASPGGPMPSGRITRPLAASRAA